LQTCHQRHKRIGATNLSDNQSIYGAPQMGFKGAYGIDHLIAIGDFLITHRRCTHPRKCTNKRIIYHLIDINNTTACSAQTELSFQANASQVCVSATASTQYTGANGNGFNIV
jgi:hypothetical protein